MNFQHTITISISEQIFMILRIIYVYVITDSDPFLSNFAYKNIGGGGEVAELKSPVLVKFFLYSFSIQLYILSMQYVVCTYM